MFPFKLRFEPTAAVHTRFPKVLPGSDGMAYVDQLKSIPANTALYDVYALDAPPQLGGKEQKIGSLQLDGQLISSKWGDEHLFFRHQRLDDDVGLRPAWEPYLPRWSLDGKCPFQK